MSNKELKKLKELKGLRELKELRTNVLLLKSLLL